MSDWIYKKSKQKALEAQLLSSKQTDKPKNGINGGASSQNHTQFSSYFPLQG